MKQLLFFTCMACLLFCCQPTERQTVFELMDPSVTNVDFRNDLDFVRDFNIYTYRNFYNGGGVAVGDIDGDGLVDIYFTGNMLDNRLYRNLGNFQFEDITESAGVAGEQAWSTGVTMADVNGDGWLDIYVCNSGDVAGDNKKNELFINQGNGTFVEQASLFGLDDSGYGTHASFFDYDRDGDLDAYLLNNSYRSIFDFNLRKEQRPVRDSLGGDKLLRHDVVDGQSVFIDVSEEAGIYGSEIGFGLGVTVGDVNRDGWPDIFVSNDFFERDYLYINQQNGSFKESVEEQIKSLSVASMGADMADLNNDAYPEIFVTEMLPEDESRYKTKMTFENWDRYQYNLQNGYYHQFTRNVLQLNNRDNSFSEIGRMAGVEATDWSWGALIADYDNDGRKDLYVCNGLYKDIIDQDYINFVSNEEIVKQMVTKEGVNYQKLIDTIPSTKISNYMFHQTGDLQFVNKSEEWGLSQPSHSNGSSYADLDNDGDLDLIVSNVNDLAFVYRNNTQQLDSDSSNYLRVNLKGSGMNQFAVGANLSLFAGDQLFYLENQPIRGFQSSVDHRLLFGLGNISEVDSIVVFWPDGSHQSVYDIDVNQELTIRYNPDGIAQHETSQVQEVLFQEVTVETNLGLNFIHRENRFVDFDRDRLIFHMVSTEGPKLAVGDVNKDGLSDLFVGGAIGQPGALFIQGDEGDFSVTNESVFYAGRGSEDLGCLFLDVDNDGDQDLYVAHGGNEYLMANQSLVDQLYLNQGDGSMTRSPQYLPTFNVESTSCVEATDYDGDGDTDLFVGVRIKPGYYGYDQNGYILNNNGEGQFTNVSSQVAPDLTNIGMITDASWQDIDGDDDMDLVVVGEWMSVSIFINQSGRFSLKDRVKGPSSGWWNVIKGGDIDGDGDVDFVLGNHGLNSRFAASEDKPITLYVNDFDQNNTPDPIICQYNGSESYPLCLRHDLVMQLPHLKKKYTYYKDYKEQTIEQIFDKELISSSVIKNVYELRSVILLNDGSGRFDVKALPQEAQLSPVYAVLLHDWDQDGYLDVLIGGNLYAAKPEVGRYDASNGLYMKGNGDGTFEVMSPEMSGFKIEGEIRDLGFMQIGDTPCLVVAKNNAPIQVFAYNGSDVLY